MSDRRKVLVVTVGTSALTAEKLGKGWSGQDAMLKSRNRYLEEKDSDRPQKEKDDGLFHQVVKAHRHNLNRKFHRSFAIDPLMSSAEMASMALLLLEVGGLPGLFDATRDRMVLITSDTEEGKFCARVNARLLHEYLTKCRCGETFQKWEATCPAILLRYVKGMEAKKEFVETQPALATILQEFTQGKTDYFYNITGGYKGAIPALTWIAVQDFPGPMFYLHASNDSAVRVDIHSVTGVKEIRLRPMAP